MLSIRTETMASAEHFRVILRTKRGTLHETIPASVMGSQPLASRMAKLLCHDITTERFFPIAFPGSEEFLTRLLTLSSGGSELILQYDEHVITNTYKFGIFSNISSSHGKTER